MYPRRFRGFWRDFKVGGEEHFMISKAKMIRMIAVAGGDEIWPSREGVERNREANEEPSEAWYDVFRSIGELWLFDFM